MVQPYDHFVMMGWCDYRLTRTSSTIKSVFIPAAILLEDGESEGLEFSPTQLKERVLAKKLWSPKGKTAPGGKKEQELPLRSLVKKDFEGADKDKLAKRAAAVATALGSDNARGRIGSLGLMSKGLNSFEKWWAAAPPLPKAKLLSDGKQWKQFTKSELDLLGAAVTNCPFRGTVPTPHEEEEKEEVAEE